MLSKRAVLRLVLALGSVAAIAACDGSITDPSPKLIASRTGAVKIEGDTLLCRSGWIVINGRYECVDQ